MASVSIEGTDDKTTQIPDLQEIKDVHYHCSYTYILLQYVKLTRTAPFWVVVTTVFPVGLKAQLSTPSPISLSWLVDDCDLIMKDNHLLVHPGCLNTASAPTTTTKYEHNL